MTTDVTLDLDADEALCEAATQGPWTIDEDGCCIYTDRFIGAGPEADVAFVAGARERWLQYIAEVRRLRDVIAGLVEEGAE